MMPSTFMEDIDHNLGIDGSTRIIHLPYQVYTFLFQLY